MGDLDAQRQRVPIRDSKGNQDRLVALPEATWQIDCDGSGRCIVIRCLFANRHGGLKSARLATTPLDRSGVQTAL
ncbi:MAG: hypothetical protein ACRER2_17875 [Methylococcales bacterium]